MRSLKATRRPAAPRDPAPSKWGYRYQRMMLTPGFRGVVRIGVPMLLIAVIAGTWFGKEENRALFSQRIAEAKASVQQRPEFMLDHMYITGADPQTEVDVATVLPLTFPVSSFDLDMEEARKTVEALYAVETASVRVGEDGALQIDVKMRIPVAVWRDGETLRLIDAGGVFAGVIDARADRLDLPLIAGDGAQAHIDEALALFNTAGPVIGRVRGLVRMGERRWDMVMDRGQRILLPEEGAMQALDRVMALNGAQELLDRDVATVDMRNPNRAIVRMTTDAATALRRVAETGN